MQRRWLVAALSALAACDPVIENTDRVERVTARFDPAVAIVPTPNDLATDPKTGRLSITPLANASEADRTFIAYLNSLDGFPPSATATATFDGNLDPASVGANSVRVYDITDGNYTPVTVAPTYVDTNVDPVKGTLSVPPPVGGWLSGHSYAVGLSGGDSGLKGTNGHTVVGSATWAFIRNEKSLVTCTDLTAADCQTATELIPSAIKNDAAKRLADQTAKALQLERLRLKYKPTIDKLIADGVKREDIVLAWSFRISSIAQAVFDPAGSPPKVPTPTDLVVNRETGLLNIPLDPSYSAAYKEFITDYLNTLDGYPVTATATGAVAGAEVNKDTVNASTVLVLPLDGKPLTGATIAWNETTKTIDVKPPNGTWGKGRKVAIVVFGRLAKDVGSAKAKPAVEIVGGGAVVGSTVWALARGSAPLVDCPKGDLKSPDCKRLITAAPLTDGQAISLEVLRQSYAPVLAAVEKMGRSREEVALLWTFSTVSLPEATFDPSNQIIPFPNNILMGSNGKLNLPVPDGGSALQQNLVLGLNTLDGFSLTAPVVSENSVTQGAIDIGEIDPATLDAGTHFIRPGAPAPAQPSVTACLNCASSLLPDGGTPANPAQLQFIPKIPLVEKATYAAYLTADLKNKDGKKVVAAPAFALMRLSNALCENAKSTVPVISDLQACGVGTTPGLEALRLGHKQLFDGLAAAGTLRKDIALAWAFTTQSTVSVLSQLTQAVASLPSMVTTVSHAPVLKAQLGLGATPVSNIADPVYIGTATLPWALGATGTLVPPMNWSAKKAPYILTVPTSAEPTGGYPVVIFGHGLTGDRTNMFAIANALAGAGFVTLAVDTVLHGARNSCNGYGAFLQSRGTVGATDDYLCALPGDTQPNPAGARCEATTGRCMQRGGAQTPCTADAQCFLTGKGMCVAGNCEGADFYLKSDPSPNAWNFLNLSNLFATRDNFRHAPLDFTQLVRIIKADAFNAAAGGGPHLSATEIHYVGMSLGGFNGALFSAVNGDVKNVLLNVVGSSQTDVLLLSPAFKPQRDGFLASLAPLGLTPGTVGFDQLMVLTRTIFDPSDTQNFGFAAVNASSPSTRKVFIQSIETDVVVPNLTTDKLINAATSGQKQPLVKRWNPSFTTLPPADRHGFLLNFKDPTTTGQAQAEAAAFISTGMVP